jgi:hypothetical protein
MSNVLPWPDIEVHRDYVAGQLKAGVTAATIHQRLRDEYGLAASVASFRRWVAANLPEEARRICETCSGADVSLILGCSAEKTNAALIAAMSGCPSAVGAASRCGG